MSPEFNSFSKLVVSQPELGRGSPYPEGYAPEVAGSPTNSLLSKKVTVLQSVRDQVPATSARS